MATHRQTFSERIYKDKDGHITLWQAPNFPLYGWGAFKILAMILSDGRVQHASQRLSMAFLFIWAFLEMTQGVNYFRRTLGALVFLMIILSFWK